MRLYVGNLPWSATEDEVRELFAGAGEVTDVALITDRDMGRSRGFAFVEMNDEAAQKAITEFDGYDWGGRPLRVNEAQERQRRDGGGGGGGRY